MTRPDVEDVARAVYQANRGKAPMEWEQLKDGAVLVQGRREYWRQMVQAVYAGMDVVDPPPVPLGRCGIYDVFPVEGEIRWKSNDIFYSRCSVCQHTWTHYQQSGASELFLAHLPTGEIPVGS